MQYLLENYPHSATSTRPKKLDLMTANDHRNFSTHTSGRKARRKGMNNRQSKYHHTLTHYYKGLRCTFSNSANHTEAVIYIFSTPDKPRIYINIKTLPPPLPTRIFLIMNHKISIEDHTL